MHKLYRSRHDRRLGGICGGIGQYFHIDSTLIRLFMVIICIFTAILPVLLAYVIACLIIPLEPSNHPVEKTHRLYRSRHDKKIAGICGGLSELLKMDATIIRLIFVLICIFTGIVPMILAYIVGWIIIPEE